MILDAIYIFIIILSLPFLLYKVITNERYRTGFAQRFGFYLHKRASKKKCVWMHGSSVGEILTGRDFINKIVNVYTNIDIVISAWTNTGKDIAEKSFTEKYVFFFPIDISFIIKSVFKKIKPDYVVLIELEVWPNFFILTSKLNIPIILINGRISDKSVKIYRKLSYFSKAFRESLNDNKIYCARTEDDAKRFLELGILEKNISVTGTMKYDNIATTVDETEIQQLKKLLLINITDTIFVAGSTRNGEEEVLLKAFKSLQNDFKALRLIIVPRHVERTNEIVTLINKNGFTALRKSCLPKENIQLDNNIHNKIIIVDTTGELFNIYSLADYVFVGGSLFPFGGQNFMEPAGLAKPIIVGQYNYNFSEEIKLLENNKAIKIINNKNNLANSFKSLLSNPDSAKEMGKRAQKVVLENKGATDRNINILKNFFN